MDNLEEGELPSSPEESEVDDTPYNPLPRPENLHTNRNAKTTKDDHENNSAMADDADEEEGDFGILNKESSDSDSDLEGNFGPKRRFEPPPTSKKSSSGGGMDVDNKDGGGAIFRQLARKFQDNRKAESKRNNVWGSILQEDTLTSEMTGIGVGRSIKDVGADRGAESYDYFLAMESSASSSSHNKPKKEQYNASEMAERDELNTELDEYWNNSSRKTQAIQAGKKRSVKDRLGQKNRESPEGDNSWENMSIPPPGVPRTIPDINQSVLESLKEVMDDDSSLEDNKSTLLGDELASKLSEPKTELMIGVIDMVGVEVGLELFKQTQDIESNGGMMIKNGDRRRTPGGVFLQLLRDMGSNEQETRVNHQEVKLFFAQSNRDHQQRSLQNKNKKNRRKSKTEDFKAELEAFKKINKKKQEEDAAAMANASSTADLKPLPDILTCITQRRKSAENNEKMKNNEVFDEPNAPPNSVERTLSAYDDDFLSTEADTEDIELF